MEVPPSVAALLERLWSHGHAAYVVGGSLRDVLLGREPADWDLASDARPDRLLAIFPGSVYENRFGTVAVREGDDVHEITTFRIDHEYADFRRPHRVEFGKDIFQDLARRDFTVNAMAWGTDSPRRAGLVGDGVAPTAALVDPYAGARDVEARLLRAVGDPATRFEEDALRMVRAVRLATTLDFTIEPSTLAALRAKAPLARHLSGERLAMELEKLLAAPRPSVGLRLLDETGLLEVISPDLAAQPGVPQNKVDGEDLWDHTLRTVDAAPAGRPIVRLAALVHDIGKPATLDDGPFRGHEVVGATIAAAFLERLRMPKAVVDRVGHLVRHHMFAYEADWGDAGVRRFIRRVGRAELEDLFALRAADSVGSGLPADAGGLDELRARVHEQLAASAVLERGGLAIDGDDLMRDLDVPQGPTLGRILDRLVERVIADPAINDRPTLLLLASELLAEEAAR